MADIPNGIRLNRTEVTAYAHAAAETDRMPSGSFDMPLLGLFGEVGSLLTELKKKWRDRDAYVAYEAEVIEEFGDVLWYFSAVARRADIPLAVLALKASRTLADWDELTDGSTYTFGDLESALSIVGQSNFEQGLVGLAGHVGDLMNSWRAGRFESNRDVLSAHLVEILRSLASAASACGCKLDFIAYYNLTKTYSRWPKTFAYAPLEDEARTKYERLPRHLKVFFDEQDVNGKLYVFQSWNDVIIGDRLTDNKFEKDDYRFHDVFHLSYAVFLGWSPVLRALLRLKRKSSPDVDENEDGARAILIEEGVATYVFSRGLSLELFEGRNQVSYDLLKTIQAFVAGYEVQKCDLWQWEKAILEGFAVFRQLVKARRGYVTADLQNHSLSFSPADFAPK